MEEVTATELSNVTELPEQMEEPSNLMENLRRKRQELIENRDELFPVQGYDEPKLLVKYRLLDGAELEAIGRKVSKQVKDRWQRGMLASMDTFIAACEGFYVDLGNGDPQPLEYPQGSGTPLRYEPALAEFLGFSAENARSVVQGVFANNDIAILQHAVLLGRWMGNTSLIVDEEFLGEM